jgi:acyl-CoA hydrolase
MLSISDTATEMVNWVFPEHAGAPGQIHGGRMMQWIATCGTIAASRVAHGNVVLGAMDDIDFLHPVKVGEVAVLRAQVEYVGRCSLEVGVRVYAEKPATGERALTLSSHLVFVKVDEHVKPLPVPQTVAPRGPEEEAMHAAAGERRARRLARLPGAPSACATSRTTRRSTRWASNPAGRYCPTPAATRCSRASSCSTSTRRAVSSPCGIAGAWS